MILEFISWYVHRNARIIYFDLTVVENVLVKMVVVSALIKNKLEQRLDYWG